MKKWPLIAFTVLCFSIVHANDPERIGALSAKIVLQNTQGYFGLSDGSCWKAIGFATRWRSLSEWWNSVKLVPKNYECVPNDWFLGTEIEVYPKFGNLEVNEEDASNQEALKQCTHLLINNRTGQVLFAIALHPADCIVQVFNEGHEEGYNEGLTEGRLSSYRNASDIYDSGRSAGYKTGYAEGFRAARQPEG